MKHQHKTLAFRLLDSLPDVMGWKAYHLLQRFSENKNLDKKMTSNESTYASLLELCEEVGISIQDKTLIELGSGWLPIFPYLLLYKGNVREVHTYDLNAHYQKKYILQVNELFSRKYMTDVIVGAANNFGLPKTVVYHPSTNIIDSDLPQANLLYSRFVLEHVRPEDILGMHKKFKTELPKGSHIVHFISPSDHRAYSDNTLSLQDFLKYSHEEWDKIQTKFDYHNRLRLPQYLELFGESGLEIVAVSYDNPELGSAQSKKFDALTLHSDYQKYSREELTAGSINVVLKT